MNIFLPFNLRKGWEGSWIKYLLGDYFSNATYYNESEIPIQDKSFIVANYNMAYKQQLSVLIQKNFTFGVFLLSDEFLTDNCNYVNEPECKFIIRNYVHPNLYNNPKVMTIGLGYKRNFDKYVLNNKFTEREITWNFIGSLHGKSRNEAVSVFNQLEGGVTHTTKHFNSDDYLSTQRYCEILSESLYTLCPQGHVNNETFRIFEALEAGSILIVLNNSELHPFKPGYWHYLFAGESNLPFIVAESWSEALQAVKNEIAAGRTSTRAEQCGLFWGKWKNTWKYNFHMKLALLT